MHDAIIENGIRTKFESLQRLMNERVRRQWAATEALALGRGGIAAVARATGLARNTILAGIAELNANGDSAPVEQVRRAGGGRKQVSDVETDTDNGDDVESSDELAPTAVAVLTHIVKSLVDDADSVTVEVDDSGRRPTLNVRVGEGELGRVIGRRGRTASSIRTVARAAASKDDVEIDIEFLDD